MRSFTLLSTLTGLAAAAKNAVPTLWDGSCYYPQPDPGFQLKSYIGRWYQVAGTIAPYSRDCKCTSALYGLNDNGSVSVNNTCQVGTRPISIVGTATPVGAQYGADGVFQVQFPGERAPDCPGPNYIVQGEFSSGRGRGFWESGTNADGDIDYTGEFSLVQSNNFTTLFILSREQHPKPEVIDVSHTHSNFVSGMG